MFVVKKILLCFLVLLIQSLSAQNFDVESLNKELAEAKTDTVKFVILNNLGKQFMHTDPDKAMNYFQQSLKIAQSLNHKKKIGRSLSFIAEVHRLQNRFSEAVKYRLMVLKISEELKAKPLIAICYFNLGADYAGMGNWPLSIDYNLKSAKLNEELNNLPALADNYYNLGIFNYRMQRYAESIKYLNQSLKTYSDVGDSMSIAMVYDNLSVVIDAKGDHDEGLRLALLCLDLRKRIHDTLEIPTSYLNIASFYNNRSNYGMALKYDLMALNILLKRQQNVDAGTVFLNISDIYMKLSDYEKAFLNLNKGYEILKGGEDYEHLILCYSRFSDLYERKGDFKKALKFHKLKVALNDSVFSAEKNKQTLELQTKYETEKKQREISDLTQKTKILAQENKIQQLDIRQKLFLIFGLGAAAILISIVAVLIASRNKLKANQRQMEIEQKLFRSQMNPHFIFNSLIAIQNYVYKHEPSEVAGYISGFAKLMRIILENSRNESVTVEKELAALKYYLELQQLRFPDKFEFSIEVDPLIDIDSILIPPMLSQPIIENAIEHGVMNKENGKGVITIKFSQKEALLELSVKDNGIGRKNSGSVKIAKDIHHQSLATTITEERLALLNKKSKQKFELKIVDLLNADGTSAGTEVILRMPEL